MTQSAVDFAMSLPPRAERPDMADYGVPDDLEGVLSWTWAESRLLSNRNYWVTTASAEGRPHSMPVWGVWLPVLGRFWFSCGAHARKARNLRANPQITISTSDTVEVVVIEGYARAHGNGPERTAAIRAYAEKYGENPKKRSELEEFVGLSTNVFWEVTPDRGFSVVEREDEFALRATRWVW
jgi:nitroimidazol reductase NimA-like FMN-containing flavoprotein (pyridoxamine 5'-phosphate oxidase superfamily)